jgi:hypothetical protein
MTLRMTERQVTQLLSGKRTADRKRLPVPTEHEEQVALFEWASLRLSIYPELEMLFAIPNAGAGAQSGQAGKMKAEGVKAGVPDTFLAVPRNGYYGCFIEMKRIEGSTVEPEQEEWLSKLNAQGYFTAICKGCEQAQKVLMVYLEGRL